MNKIICGVCARKLNYTLDQRKELSTYLREGINICECGRKLELKNNRLIVLDK